MFSPLSIEDMEQIVDLQMREVHDRLGEYNIQVELTPLPVPGWPGRATTPAFGARPLRRAIQKHVESPLSVDLLGGKYKNGATVLVDVDEKKNKIVLPRRRSGQEGQAACRRLKRHHQGRDRCNAVPAFSGGRGSHAHLSRIWRVSG